MPLCNGADIGCVSHIDNITGRESGLTSLYGASHERTFAALCSFPDLHYIFVTGSHFIEDSVEAA
jgi:hypothetical protein